MSRCSSLFALLLFTAIQAHAQSKIALIVAVGDYPASTGWPFIHATNDVDIIKSALIKQGFDESNIAVIRNAEATKKGIENAFQNELIDKAKPGDLAFFQFSGHGQQVADDNKDEVDGLDEAIVPYDSPLHYVNDVYQGENLIRDDEIGYLTFQLRKKLGDSGNLMVIIDACHSGTATRGIGVARGTDIIMADSAFRSTHINKRTAETNSTESAASAKGVKLAPMVAFFGSSQDQMNFETLDDNGKAYGSLSFAFSRTFTKASKQTSYRTLFDQIKLEMSTCAPRQQPQAEGELDQEIMGGRILGNPGHYKVIRWNDSQNIALDCGWMQGFKEGTVIGLFPPETRDPLHATPLATGKIDRSNALTSVVSLDKEVSQEQANTSWAYVLEKNFGDLTVTIKNMLKNDPLKEAFLEKWKEFPFIRVAEPSELSLTQSASGDDIQLLAPGEQLIGAWPAGASPGYLISQVNLKIFDFIQTKFIRSLDAEDSDMPLTLGMVRVKLDSTQTIEKERLSLKDDMDASGTLRLKDGETVKLKITNPGNKPAYFTLLDIQPDNIMRILVPDEDETPQEFRIMPGEVVEVPKFFTIRVPAGTEVFKLIATEQPIDLRPIISKRGQAEMTKGRSNPFEQLFLKTYINENTRTRGKSMSIPSGSVNIYSSTFIIDP